MKKLTSLIILLIVATCSLLAPSAPVPRKSPELTINEPSGEKALLSGFKGKVVVIEFFFIKSAHCMRVAQTLNKLQKELGPRGFQAVAIAFPAPGSDANGPLLTYMVNYFRLTYPVGYTDVASVDRYLGRGKNEVLNIPQVVVVDRAGMIRTQSGARPGDPKLENEDSLRTLLDGLLKENTLPDTPARQARPANTSKSQP
jgi:thiol-disulfide isomerase/thioredoxin